MLEVLATMIGKRRVSCWATASLWARAGGAGFALGLPLINNAFNFDMNVREDFNRSVPADDLAKKSVPLSVASWKKLSSLAGTSPHPADYGKQLASRLLPAVLPYDLGTPAGFDLARFSGRGLTDDVMDMIPTLSSNTALRTGLSPTRLAFARNFTISANLIRKMSRRG